MKTVFIITLILYYKLLDWHEVMRCTENIIFQRQ